GRRARALASVSGRRAALAVTSARGGDAGPHCARELAQGGGVVGAARAAASATVPTWGCEQAARWDRRDRVVPPESAEHQHREAHPDDVVRGVSDGTDAARGLSLRGAANREANLPSPFVGQLEGLAHIESQHPKPPGQVLERPDDRVLHFDRGPLAELIVAQVCLQGLGDPRGEPDRKSTRLNSSHGSTSYAVF